MSTLANKIKNKLKRAIRKREIVKRDKFVAKYIKSNDLVGLLELSDSLSTSTGAGLYDYVMLHSFVRKQKAKYVLECGTGKSTWVLAHAMKQNHLETGFQGKVISVESIAQWHQQAESIFPDNLRSYVELIYSPATTYMYSFIKGTAYSHIPDYPYDLVFVDGPELDVKENGLTHDTVNMDFIRYLLTTDKPATAVIDYRLKTCVAYGMIFGRDKVKFLNQWAVGVVENVSRKDMLLVNVDDNFTKILNQSTTVEYNTPSWLKGEI